MRPPRRQSTQPPAPVVRSAVSTRRSRARRRCRWRSAPTRPRSSRRRTRGSDFWTTSPAFFLLRLGLLTTAVGAGLCVGAAAGRASAVEPDPAARADLAVHLLDSRRDGLRADFAAAPPCADACARPCFALVLFSVLMLGLLGASRTAWSSRGTVGAGTPGRRSTAAGPSDARCNGGLEAAHGCGRARCAPAQCRIGAANRPHAAAGATYRTGHDCP